MNPRDLRQYTKQTNFRLVIGLILLLLLVGNGLIFIFYGQGAALFGLFCMVAVVVPISLIWLYLFGLDWIRKKYHDS
jgi:hypothetical protein